MYFSFQLYHAVACYLLGCCERELSCSDDSLPENCEFLILIFQLFAVFLVHLAMPLYVIISSLADVQMFPISYPFDF